MHVLILNQTFHPDVAATGQLMWDLAGHLDRRGHRVSVITSRYFYGTSRRHDLAFEKLGGIEVHRVGGTAHGNGGTLGRVCDFASFYLAAAAKLHQLPCPHVVLALTSPPMIATLAMLYGQLHPSANAQRVPFVYYVMDLYPDAAIASGMMSARGLPAQVTRRLTARTLATAVAVIVLGRDMKQRILRQYGHDGLDRRIHIVPPWADGELLHPLPKTENPLARSLGLDRSFNIVYSGNLGVAHDVETISAAIHAMSGDPGTYWLFIGGGHRFDLLRRQAQARRWSHVRFLPFQDRQSLNQSLNLADVHLVSQLPAFTGVVVPSKLFGILAVGRPAVMVGPPEAECSRILTEHQAGFVVPNGDASQLVSRLRTLRADPSLCPQMGHRARTAFEAGYDRHHLCARIESILHQAAR